MPIFFLKIGGNVITTWKLKFFQIFGSFLTCVACFLAADKADKKYVELQKFS